MSNRLGTELKDQRKLKNLTQSELASCAGLSVPTIRALEKGAGQISSLKKVIDVLGLAWGFTERACDDPCTSLVAVRDMSRLSQRKMARRIGVSQPTIISLEHRFTGSVRTLSRYLAPSGKPVLHNPSRPRRRAAPKKNKPEADIVMTPRELASKIVSLFAQEMDGVVLDPARGQGAFFDALPVHVERDWCELSQGKDFFGYKRKADWIISNPPYSKLRAFLSHGMELADNVVYLSHLPHFTTKARLRDIRDANFGFRRIVTVPQPASWPSSGFQLAAVHLKRNWSAPCEMSSLCDMTVADSDVEDVEGSVAELLAAE